MPCVCVYWRDPGSGWVPNWRESPLTRNTPGNNPYVARGAHGKSVTALSSRAIKGFQPPGAAALHIQWTPKNEEHDYILL